MKDLDNESKDLDNYKISIIYTFNNYSNSIELFNNYEGFKLSSINAEEKLKKSIDDIKIKNSKKHNNDFIIIYLDNCDSDKMKFTANFINKYYKEDEYHYILILFINKHSYSKFYSIPNFYNDINQLFIDHLEE